MVSKKVKSHSFVAQLFTLLNVSLIPWKRLDGETIYERFNLSSPSLFISKINPVIEEITATAGRTIAEPVKPRAFIKTIERTIDEIIEMIDKVRSLPN